MASIKKDSSSNASPPFATPNGAVPGVGAATGKPTDFTRQATGSRQGVYPGRDFTAESRSQQTPPPPSDDVARPGGIPQTPGSPEQRVDSASIPRGGVVAKGDPGAASQADGAETLGAERKPFKNLR